MRVEQYPRFSPISNIVSCRSFIESFGTTGVESLAQTRDPVVLHGKLANDVAATVFIIAGRVSSVRRAGARLVFLDIVQDGYRVQLLCNIKNLKQYKDTDGSEFRNCLQRIRRGDHLR